MTSLEAIRTAGKPEKTGQPVLYWLLTFLYSLTIFVLQLVSGVQPEFAAMVFSFTILTFWTVRVLGGWGNLFGLTVGFLALQHVIIGMVLKLVFVQVADADMWSPNETILIYNIGMAGILVGAYLLRGMRIQNIRPMFRPDLDKQKLYTISVILVVLAAIRAFVIVRFGVVDQGGLYVGGFIGPLRQLTFLPYLAIAASTAHIVVASDRKRCLSWVNFTAIMVSVTSGWLFGVRNEIVWAVLTFFITLYAFQFRLGIKHYGVAVGFALFFHFIISPYALYARSTEAGVRYGTAAERLANAVTAIVEVVTQPEKFQQREVNEAVNRTYEERRTQYFGRPMNVLERFAIIAAVSSIVDNTLLRGTTGWERVTWGVEMVAPRSLSPNKPAIGSANALAQEGKGIVNIEDRFSQPALGWIVDAYNALGKFAVFVTGFVLILAYVTLYAILIRGQMINNFIACGLAFRLLELFSEGTMAAQIVFLLQTTPVFIAIMLFIQMLANVLAKRKPIAKMRYEREPGLVRDAS